MAKTANKRPESSSVGFRPYRNMTLIRRDAPESIIGVFSIPRKHQKPPHRGTIVAVGPGERNKRGERVPVSVKPGDRVLFGQYSGYDVEVRGETLVVVHEPELLGVVVE